MEVLEGLLEDTIKLLELKTYDSFKKSGRQVKRGERSVLYFKGNYYFQKNQTKSVALSDSAYEAMYPAQHPYMDQYGIYEYDDDAVWEDGSKTYTDWFIPNMS